MNFGENCSRRLAVNNEFPGDDGAVQEGLKYFWYIQKSKQFYNHSLGKGELTEELQSWIRELYIEYSPKLTSIMGKGTQKVRLMYYGMVYTILQHNYFFLLGKNNTPINITCCKYCQLFKLNRKSLSSDIYTYNYYNKETDSKPWTKTYNIGKLEPIFYEIEENIIQY